MIDRLSQTVVMVRLNIDKAETKPFSKQYHVGGIPTVIVFNAQGQEVDRIIGYDDDRSAWLKTLLGYLYGIDTIEDMQHRYAAKPDVVMAHDLAQKYLDRGDGPSTLLWVEKARSLKPDAGTANKLTLIQGQGLLLTDPPKGTEALMGLATAPDNALGVEAFQALSAYYKRQARNATSPQEKKQANEARLEVFHKVMAARPSDPDVLTEYAWTCAGEGIELDKALAAAQKAAEIKKDDADTLAVLAEVYYKSGNKPAALETVDRALKLAPDETFIKTLKDKYSSKDEAKPKP